MEHWLPLFEERLVTLFDHLDESDTIVIDTASMAAAEERISDIADYFEQRTAASGQAKGSYRPLKPDALYLAEKEFKSTLADVNAHRATPFDEPESDTVVDFGFRSGRDFAPERARGDNVYPVLAEYLKTVGKDGKRPILATYSTGSRARIASILTEAGTAVETADSWQEALGASAKGKPVAVVLPLEASFANDEMEVLTEQDILGDRLVRRKKKRRDADAFLAELQALSVGDLIVHTEHGIGKYLGLEPVAVGKSQHDCVQLEYKGGDKLFIPVENIDVLSRYGSSEEAVMLDRLGGEAWQKRRARLKERIREIAGELMQVAAQRALKKAPVLEVDDGAYNQFLDRFPWEETDDQDRAISDVLRDLESGRPMDRLVCGDVGFGKTEVALRAAFVAAMNGQQVAMVAPTTLLARQHFENFRQRFAGFPLKIGRLSRLVPSKEMKETREGLESGDMDIVVGTHAILSKQTKFKDLGLVIVDEEQRFGVTHKEKLKQLRADVHMLTLTATPIPRTLQMAMTGLRELSTIQTPPVDRLAVRTYVMEWDDMVMREALLREHHRGGQSFIVVPRITDMDAISDWLREHVPEVKVVQAHGQMGAGEIEERMSAFYEGKYEVLLATTIVESGLDLPSANTIIIHRADIFGLAQLYQLRGRVGRAKLRAYAYLTYEKDTQLSEVAEKRLKVLGDLDSLGAGFQLASHDLDIRGAGNLLGDEQSGHIREVGFELYQSMLEDAILAAKAGEMGLEAKRETVSPQITVDAPIMIPEEYVPDLAVRMALYRRLNDADSQSDVEALAAEMIDRFGPLPSATENLVRLIQIKLQAVQANIAKIDVGAAGTLVTFHKDDFPDGPGLSRLCRQAEGHSQAPPGHEAGHQPRLEFARKPPQRALSTHQGAFGHREESEEARKSRRLAQGLIDKGVRSHRLSLQEPLKVFTVFGSHEVALRFVLHAFDQHTQIERLGHTGNGTEHGAVSFVLQHAFDHRPVELDTVDRENLEVSEVAEACAKVVERDQDIQHLELLQDAADAVEVGQEHLLGDFQRDARKRKSYAFGKLRELDGEIVRRKVRRSDIDGKAQVIGPAHRFLERSSRDVPGQMGDVISALGNLEQSRCADLPDDWMVPARQRFRADHPAIDQRVLRLEKDFDLFPVDCGE